MSKMTKACIVGPAIDVNYIGGVATHIRNLKSLSCFKDAAVLDPGSFNSNSKTNFFKITRNIIAFRKTINDGNYSHILINSSIYKSAFIKLLIILAVVPNKDRVIHVFFHGGRFAVTNYIVSKILNFVCRPLIRKVKTFHFLSTIQLNGFKHIFSDSPTALYANYATADDIWQKMDESDPTKLKLLFVGRLVKEKGVFELFAAIKKLSANNKNIELTIAGDGPELADLVKLSKRLPDNTVHFAGYLSGVDLEAAYQNADVLLLPSYHPEGFPYVVIEAMRAGLPIISTDSGALESLVVDGVTGFKVKPKDIDSIVLAIEKLLNDRRLMTAISNNCYRYFQENLSRSAAESYYAELLNICHALKEPV